MREKFPHRYDLVLAHCCSYRGRRYFHLAFRGDGKLLSLVLTRRQAGESFARDGLVPVLWEFGIPLYRAGIEHFEVAGFETQSHLVFLVSDLEQAQNRDLAAGLVAATRDFLVETEGGSETGPAG